MKGAGKRKYTLPTGDKAGNFQGPFHCLCAGIAEKQLVKAGWSYGNKFFRGGYGCLVEINSPGMDQSIHLTLCRSHNPRMVVTQRQCSEPRGKIHPAPSVR